MEIYRTQVRLYMDDPKEAEIVKKIKERNKVLHKSINDYIIHALYEFENKEIKEKFLRQILKEELQNLRLPVLPDEEREKEEDCGEEKPEEEQVFSGIHPDILGLLGK